MSAILSSIDIIKHGEEIYIPVVADVQRDAHGKLQPRPETVLISNLRNTVEELANEQTPLTIRVGFEENCPIPGAIWFNHILQNPDEIMPKDYSYDTNLNEDINLVQIFLYQLRRYAPYMVSNGLFRSQSIFVSNQMGTLRCANRNQGQPLNDYYQCALEGNIKDYSTPKKLSNFDTLTGMVCLLGELPSQGDILHPLYKLRDSTVHSYHHYDLSYKDICPVMYMPR